MTKQEIADLQLAGLLVKELEDGRVLVEGTSPAGLDYLLEEDFGIWWVYEATANGDYTSVDAFGLFDDAYECAKKLS
ncbi:hypothetical protein [Kosakonia phage Kc304]|uniref:Uncharacterized protein n=2 Tax=Winklervirus chi14 TaxID=2560752 RepID=A0A1Z1LY83_9CAUD|nr:hypothetical protein FDI23_gp064 [Serratia phage CHI14]ARW57487.1 hypothetical protein [Serratia phage CHI14]ARW57762.1 hypothetical protein [Serratia phage CBH8]QYN80506.1 hypothetical protein [Kosakonia phage Kc304]